jgi:Family of unknown function (DUF5988)
MNRTHDAAAQADDTQAADPQAADDKIDAALEGGPATLPPSRRRVRIARETQVMKVPHYGGYEHFVRTESRLHHDGPVLFRWSARTHIAE